MPDGWVNVDGSIRAWLVSKLPWFDRMAVRLGLLPPTEFKPSLLWANLLKRFPWADGSCDALYLGEILEHFTREQGEYVLRECRRVLAPGGVIRIRVPDNARFWRNYLDEYDAQRRLPPDRQDASHERWVHMFFREICTNPKKLGSAGHYHKWMYDEVSLTRLLHELGFDEVARREFHDSAIEDIEAIEARDDLIVEAVKPSVVAKRSLAA